MAMELDAKRLSLDMSTLPLFGMPFSVKDMIGVKGMDATLGLHKRVNIPCKEDAAFVQMLKEFGGIPFVKTNNPQTCMR